MSYRVALVAGDPSEYRGGVSRLVRILRDGLEGRGHEVDCFAPSHVLAELKISAVALRDYGQYDVVHINGPTPFLSDAICLNPTVRRLVLTYHSDNEWLSPALAHSYKAVHRLLHNRTDRVVVSTQSYADAYGSHPGRVRVVPFPGPAWAARPDVLRGKPREFTVLFVGQLRPYKGVPVLLEAARRQPKVRFVIAGDGRLRSTLEELSRGLDNVEFVGSLSDDDLQSAYSSAHVVCLPSTNRSEAFGLALLEGATFGAVPIASDLLGVNENVRTLQGEVFRVGDFLDLSNLIRHFDDDRQEWEKRARATVASAGAYNAVHTRARYVEQHEQLYNELVKM